MLSNKDKMQDEAFAALKKAKFNGTIQMPTGSGKAKVLVEVLKHLRPKKCWYLCDSKVNRDETFRNEIIKWGGEDLLDRVEFYCYQTAYRFIDNRVDLVLADEADFIGKAYANVFYNNQFKHVVLATATIADDKIKMIEKIAPIVYKKELGDIEGKGIVNETDYYIVKYMLTKEENFRYLRFNAEFARLLNAKKPNKFEIEKLQIQRNLFLNKLGSSLIVCKNLVKELYKDEKRKILIFTGVATKADAVSKYSYHSKADNDENFSAFERGDIRILSVVGKIDRGANINGVNTVIFEAPFKSKTKQQQKSGRGRRLSLTEKLEVYFLVPYFKDVYGNVKPTIVDKWVTESVGDIDFKPKVYHLKS